MSGRGIDAVALVAGLAALVAGALLALDANGSIGLSAGWIGALACATAGSVLVVSGIVDRER